MTFGERIVYFREKKGLSQKGLAEIAGITANRLYYYEKDKRQPDVETIKTLARALGVTGDDLLGTSFAKEKTPAPKGTEDREKGIDEVESQLRSLLLTLGLAPDNLTAEQVDFLSHVVSLIQAYFKK